MMPTSTEKTVDPGSFRDPAGFVYHRNGLLYRQINTVGRADYERLMASGLYQNLTEANLLVQHQEVVTEPLTDDGWKTIAPEPVPFVSYPFEWSFSQLKAAALTTLDVQEHALRFGQELKDATAFNIQFVGARPVFIDTLSFTEHQASRPWPAYRQFCEHFLVPLALMSQIDEGISRLQLGFIDGIPLRLGSRLLPLRSWFRWSTLCHIHLHAWSQRVSCREGSATDSVAPSNPSAHETSPIVRSDSGFKLWLTNSLRNAVMGLHWNLPRTTWGDYYQDTNYSPEALDQKRTIVTRLLAETQPRTVWDLGANDGRFSKLAGDLGAMTLAIDSDPVAVERNFRRLRHTRDPHVLPLLVDLLQPSPALGWRTAERRSLEQRGPADTILALALVHHLAIGHNIPLLSLSEWLGQLSRFLIIEFVPKEDSQAQRLLTWRTDIFPDYTQARFEAVFSQHFVTISKTRIPDTMRTLYLMRSIGT